MQKRGKLYKDIVATTVSMCIINMLTMSYTFRYPYENAIAFGGVDMGIMNAKDADTAAGIIR